MDFWFQAQLKMRQSAIAQNIAFAVSSALRIGLVVTQAPLVCYAAVILLDGPLTALILLRMYRRMDAGRLTWRTDLARTWLRACWPLLLGAVVNAGFARLDQAFVLMLAGSVEAGHFAAASRIFELASFVPLALATSLIPSIAGNRDNPDAMRRAVQHASNALSAISWAVAAIVMLGAGWISGGLFGSAFGASETPLRVLAIALVFQGLGAVRTEAWICSGWARRLLIGTLAGAVLNVALALFCIPRWGATGGAFATTAALALAHVGTSFWWRETRPSGLWQIRALTGAALWFRKRAAES